MDTDQYQCSNKNTLMLTIKDKTELHNSNVGDRKLNLKTVENTSVASTSENSNATKKEKYLNRKITVLPRKCIDTENQFQKTPVVI